MKKLIFLFLFAVISSGAFSQWTTNSALNTPVCVDTASQKNPTVIPDISGGIIIVWEDSRGTLGNTDIYVQRLDAAGYPQWTANGVPVCTNDSTQALPVLVEDGKGGAIVVWQDHRNGNKDIYAQYVNSAGVIQWAADGVPVDNKSGNQQNPRAVSDGANGAIITWQDSASGMPDKDIYAQRINVLGAGIWSAGGVALSTAPNTQNNPHIESDGAGGAFVVWQDKRNGVDYDIYAQKINASGVQQWTVNGAPVCVYPQTQNNPKLKTDGAGGVIVAWSDKRSGSDYDIYAQRLNSSGVPQWAANGIIVSAEVQNQNTLDMSSFGISGAMITWKDYRNNAYADIYAQYINLSGTPQWTVNGIPICTKPLNEFNPNIITDASGGIIVWQDSSSGQWDVYGQKILLNGTAQWGTNGKIISNADSSQTGPKHVSDGNGGAIVAWQDKRALKSDIYAQHINSNGSLGVGVEELQYSAEEFIVYPNPTSGKIEVRSQKSPDLWYGTGEIGSLEIYNILGEKIYQSTIVSQQSTIDLSSQPNAIYFLKIISDKEVVNKKIIIQH